MGIGRIKDILSERYNYFLFYILFLLIFVTFYLIQWPISLGDNDLWYHLNGGRYILDHFNIPKDSYFSFISPPREWVDYYWLFQVIVYFVYSLFNYYGLVFLRVIVFLSIIFFILYFFVNNHKDKRQNIYLPIILSLYLLMLLPRYHLIRPHMFSYLFIVVFLYIIEFKPKKVIYLPIFSILWTNLPGVEYPVMLLILLAYIIEFFINHMRVKTHFKREDLLFIVPIIASIAAVYFTPHGYSLTWMPFIPTGFANLYIQELRRLSIDDFLSFQIVKLVLSHTATFSILFILSCLAAVSTIVRGGKRISHFVIFAGALVLLTQGNRFRFEFVLLALPILNDYLSNSPWPDLNKKNVVTAVIPLMIVILFIPVISIKNFFSNPPKFPFSHRGLPYGTTIFLNKIDAKGTILNSPSNGGYLQWMLYPRCKIFMDMEVPFLFTNEDMFTATYVFINENIFRDVIGKYSPNFILVPIARYQFKELIKGFPDYKMVFFDETEVLYVNKKRFPAITIAHEVKELDPFTLMNALNDVRTITNNKRYLFIMAELIRLLEIYPECGLKNQIAGMVCIDKGDFNKAIYHADNIIREFPEVPIGYKIKADALNGMKQFDDAVVYYKKTLAMVSNKSDLNKEIGMVYMKQHKYEKAYTILKKTANIFNAETNYRDLFYLALSAFLSGKEKDAEIILKYAYPQIPKNSREWNERFSRLSAIMGLK